jgi:hypothetical protein
MFVIPSKYLKDISPVFESIESIIKFHPNEKILIVDSYSEDDSYLFDFEKYDNVFISKHKNKHYECGALYYAYDEFPNEKFYALIQDSIILKRDWNEFINNDITYNLMYFREQSIFQEREYNYVKKVIELTKYNYHHNLGHVGIFGMMAIYKQDDMKEFKGKNLLESALPIDKFGSQMCERIFGICLTQDGNDIIKNTMEGDFLSKINLLNNDELVYFKKIFLRRQ